MKRTLPLCLGLLVCASVAGAQDRCGDVDDLNRLRALPDPPDLAQIVGASDGDWSATARRVDRLRAHALAEDARAPSPPLRALAAVLDDILANYDGTAGRAAQARLDMLSPTACASDEEGFPTCAWEVLDARVQVPFGASAAWTCDGKARFARYLVDAHALVAHALEPHVARAAKSLAGFARQWDRYVANGYSQYPHELWLNGAVFLDRDAWGPPANQLIALHPAVGFGTANMTEAGNAGRAAAFVLAVEALGFVRYLGEFRHHIGVSAAAALPNFEWDGVGVGPVVHFDGFGVGYNVGLRNDRPDTLYLLLDVTRSIDDGGLLAQAGDWIRDHAL